MFKIYIVSLKHYIVCFSSFLSTFGICFHSKKGSCSSRGAVCNVELLLICTTLYSFQALVEKPSSEAKKTYRYLIIEEAKSSSGEVFTIYAILF